MGRMQREKGKAYEREIANEFRKRWPSAVVRRASQAERADNPDVFIEGGPPILAKLWLELQDARMPVPLTKLGQAERDAIHWASRRTTDPRLPVVIWHRLGERTSYATARLRTFDKLRWYVGTPYSTSSSFHHPVTMRLDEFLEMLYTEHPNKCTCSYEVGSGRPVCECWFGEQRACSA